MTPGNGGGGDKGMKSRGSSESSDEVKVPKKLGFELYRRPKELPYMTFEHDSTEEVPNKSCKEEDIWSEMAFVVCTKSKNDMKSLIHKVQNYEENPQQNLNLGGRRGRLRSAVSSQK